MNVTRFSFRHTPHYFINLSVYLSRSFAMDTLSAGKEISYKEAFDSGPNKSFADRIIPHILRLYGSCATSHDFEIYAQDASFEDPLMRAHGYLVSQRLWNTVLKKIWFHQILIDNKQHYKFLGKDIDMVSLIKLSVEEGKVVRHEDWWDKKPISNRDTVKLPLLGRVAEMTRRGSMLATHVFMRFGKDPTV
ncbi:uncharacterized protein [Cicer arietinum]|uniref:Uncharacterized protein LOC101493409 isoform X2 n=1 Tax=Cicer arietinum TaxID=3827 RepID=A0A1S2XXR1_CICAR|nr:uncharacterized protein LOC101493409 isoform X2 [Cicer arietinum]